MQPLRRLYSRARIDDRQINELIGLCQGVLADGTINQQEAEFVLRWLESNRNLTDNPMVNALYTRISEMLSDGVLDLNEQRELLEVTASLVGGAPMPDGLNYATSLPITQPERPLLFSARNYCFTGTFAYGTRAECAAVTKAMGARTGELTLSTDYLVIGIYATDAWIHSSYGRKIEKAVQMRADNHPIAIVSEQHWVSHL